MEKLVPINKAFSYLDSTLGKDVLREGILGVTEKTYSNYLNGKLPSDQTNINYRKIQITFVATSMLYDVISVEVRKEIYVKLEDGKAIIDHINLFSQIPDLDKTLSYLKEILVKKVEDYKKTRPIERFRSIYTHFNEENIKQACEAGDYKILKEIIASTKVRALAKGYALIGIAENDVEKEHYEYIKDFQTSDSPYLREACVMGLYQYLDEDDSKEVENFKNLLKHIREDSKSFSGVIRKIDTILDSIDLQVT